jgi:rod shape-determining protein MreC
MFRHRTLFLLVVMCLGHVLLISAQVQSKSGMPVIEDVAFGAFSGVQKLTASLADSVRSLWTNYFALRGAARDNENLRRRILELEAQLQEQQALSGRTRALEDALGLRQSQASPTIAARVIAGSPSPNALTVTIDRGSDDGIGPDMAVIGAKGIIGRVISPVAPRAATVQLLIDRNAGASVVFERSQAGGMVTGGAGNPPLRAEFVPPLADIQPGERVTTAGQDGIYPAGFVVGTVETVTRGATATDRRIGIRPAVDFSYLDVVLVVITPPAVLGSGK